jgi:uncharacterized protein YceK
MHKKVVGGIFIVLLVLMVASAGCTSSVTTTSPSPTTTSPSTQAQTTQTAQTTGSSNGLTLTVSSQGEATTIGVLSKADTGKKFVLYNAVLKNINVKDLDVNPYWFDLRLSNGSSVGLDLFAWAEVKGSFPLTNNTQPGDTVNGTIVFEISQTATPVAIQYYDLTYNVTAKL